MLLVSGVPLCACGGGGRSATAAVANVHVRISQASATGDPVIGGPMPSRAQALAFAHAVNLRAGDLPGFKESPAKREGESASDKQFDRQMRRCVGAAVTGVLEGAEKGKALADVKSDSFKREAPMLLEEAQSSVEVMRTGGVPRRALALIRSNRVRTCLATALGGMLRHMAGSKMHGATARLVSVTTTAPPAPGADGSFGWRVAATIATHGVTVPVYFDILAFISGRAAVMLMTSSLPAPFPAATENHLFALLVERAQAPGA